MPRMGPPRRASSKGCLETTSRLSGCRTACSHEPIKPPAPAGEALLQIPFAVSPTVPGMLAAVLVVSFVFHQMLPETVSVCEPNGWTMMN